MLKIYCNFCNSFTEGCIAATVNLRGYLNGVIVMVWFPDFCGAGWLRVIFQSFFQRFLTFSSEISYSSQDNFPLSVEKINFPSLILDQYLIE